ncbi:MAG: chalcone isomerase family protein [Alphaproteobacteria bacterium]|nr:chalcone isomerase family protein [Alphaproteobacteria bacterium]
MRKLLFILALMTGQAQASGAPEYVAPHVRSAQEVGAGRLTYLMWDVYDATLFAPEGKWQPQRPYALTLTYLRELEGKAIADRSIEEIRRQGGHDEVTLAAWHSQLRAIFPDVRPRVSLTGIYTEKGETIFFENGRKIGHLLDPEFSRAFFAIWLGEKTSEPALREQLLGMR